VSTTTLPYQETVAEVLKSLETETTALFDYLRLEFLLELSVFASNKGEHGCLSRLNCFGDCSTASIHSDVISSMVSIGESVD
jgi:hypothetical protein